MDTEHKVKAERTLKKFFYLVTPPGLLCSSAVLFSKGEFVVGFIPLFTAATLIIQMTEKGKKKTVNPAGQRSFRKRDITRSLLKNMWFAKLPFGGLICPSCEQGELRLKTVMWEQKGEVVKMTTIHKCEWESQCGSQISIDSSIDSVIISEPVQNHSSDISEQKATT